MFIKKHEIKRMRLYSNFFDKNEEQNLKYIYMGEPKKRFTLNNFINGYLRNEIERLINSNIQIIK